MKWGIINDMRKKWPRLFSTSIAIGLACVLGLYAAVTRLEGIEQYETAAKIAQPINILNIQILTEPSYYSGDMSNDSIFDMSGAPDKTQVTGFSVTVDQSCDLQLNMIDKIIPLSGGQTTLVNLDDLISGTQGGDGISLKTFRTFYGDSVTIRGKLKKNDSVVGKLSITMKL